MDGLWPFSGRFLIIDNDPAFWANIRRELEQLGCPCRVAVSQDIAIDLLKKDSQLKVVLLDQGLTNGHLESFVTEIKSIRSDVTIVGISACNGRDNFAAIGVHHFLLKPWSLNDLIDELTYTEPETLSCTGTRIGKANPDTQLIQFSFGQIARISVGPMEGWTGTVVAQRSGGRILLRFEEGVFLELQQFCVEIVHSYV